MKKLIKKFIIIILIINIICLTPLYVYANIINNAKSESGPNPNPGTPADDPPDSPIPPSQPTNPHNPEDDITEIVTLNSFEYIEGNVYEDLGEQYVITNGNEGNNDKKDSQTATLPLSNIIVKCGNMVTKTDENGKWHFNVSPRFL